MNHLIAKSIVLTALILLNACNGSRKHTNIDCESDCGTNCADSSSHNLDICSERAGPYQLSNNVFPFSNSRFQYFGKEYETYYDITKKYGYLSDYKHNLKFPKGLDCKRSCSDGDRRCVWQSNLYKQPMELSLISDLLSSDTELVTKGQIMKAFSQNVDRCSRSDVTFKDGILYNSGDGSCNVAIRAKDDVLTVYFTSDFALNYNPLPKGGFRLSSNSGAIVVTNSDVESGLNGIVSDFTMTQENLYIGIGELCLVARFE